MLVSDIELDARRAYMKQQGKAVSVSQSQPMLRDRPRHIVQAEYIPPQNSAYGPGEGDACRAIGSRR